MIKVYKIYFGFDGYFWTGIFQDKTGLFWDHIVSRATSEDFSAQKVTRSENCKASNVLTIMEDFRALKASKVERFSALNLMIMENFSVATVQEPKFLRSGRS